MHTVRSPALQICSMYTKGIFFSQRSEQLSHFRKTEKNSVFKRMSFLLVKVCTPMLKLVPGIS